MKVIFVPFNNANYIVEQWDQGAVMGDILRVIRENHLDGEKAVLMLYLSNPSQNFLCDLDVLPAELEGVYLIVKSPWSIDEGEKLALQIVNGDPQKVICVRLIPEDLLDSREMKRQHDAEKERFGWAYCVTVKSERTERGKYS